jgi:hypothetical protein
MDEEAHHKKKETQEDEFNISHEQSEVAPIGELMENSDRDNFVPVKNPLFDGEEFCSHNSTSILDGERVSFKANDPIDGLADNDSEESFEADMVYYHKEDLTNYSKNLKLNKVKKRETSPTMLLDDESVYSALTEEPNTIGHDLNLSMHGPITPRPRSVQGRADESLKKRRKYKNMNAAQARRAQKIIKLK